MEPCKADQLTRLASTRITKHGRAFNIMFAGHAGSGKTSLINSLFDFDYGDVPDFEKKVRKVTSITKEYSMRAEKVQMKVTIIEIKGLGHQENLEFSYQPIVDYIDEKHLEYQKDYQNYNYMSDNRVHCCVYIVSPFGPEPIDIKIMRELSERVCLIPVIGCSGYLSTQGVSMVKDKIRQSIAKHNLNIYGLSKYDIPFAIIASNEITEESGKQKRTKMINNTRVSIEDTHEFSKLKTLLVQEEMLSLIESTDHICYERARRERVTCQSRQNKEEFDDQMAEIEARKAEMQQKIRFAERHLVA